MAQNSTNSTTPPCAGVGPQHAHSNVSSESGSLGTENTLIWNDIDFSGIIPNPFVALAMMATHSGGSNTADPVNHSSLHDMPTEVLIEISNAMSPVDRISAAFAFPDLFINANRYHVFYDDAITQLNIPTYILFGVEHDRRPLLLEAISHGFNVEQISFLLDVYEEICVARNIDRHTFLNSAFPDNRPADPQPSSPGSNSGSDADELVTARNLFSPLHIAIGSHRLDLVRYLIQRGADLDHLVTRPISVPFTPLQYALYHLSPMHTFFSALSQSQRDILIDIASELLTHSPNISAYTTSLAELTREMFLAIEAGAEPIVLTLLERTAPTIGLPAITGQQIQILRSRVLQYLANNQRPMPRALRYVLNEGALWTETDEYRDNVRRSATHAAIDANNVEHAVISLRHEIENKSSTLTYSIRRICHLSGAGAHLAMLQALVPVLVEFNQEEAQLRVLLSAMTNVPGNGPLVRDMLLGTTTIINDTSLRFAICFGDRTTTAHIIRVLVERSQSIDDRLPRGSLLAPPILSGHWFETPLTYALSLNNYHAASQLLSFGANPSRVPANIRHRVRIARDRLNSLIIDDVMGFVFQVDGVQMDGSQPTIEETHQALDYVFVRMLDDPAHPLPHYSRAIRNEEQPADHPDNDSDNEDQFHRGRCVAGLRFSGAPWR
ncbi:hypothetical protein RRF57_001837 [Xylaria bambusicola]|uniref:Ankyrin repeat protein n=1 Tax=Xylaria bambusicola TaxID=326684 RepID=A0AAN7Z1X6_9PEZI